jgi:hypothetical protein
MSVEVGEVQTGLSAQKARVVVLEGPRGQRSGEEEHPVIGLLGSCLMQNPSQVLSAHFDHVKSWVGTGESLAVTAPA